MNHIYKSIFNKALGVFTAVPEFASAHGKGSERTVVGRVAKGTAGFAASALAISVGLALTSTSAVASAGIYVNDGTDPGCLALPDTPYPNTGIYGISSSGNSIVPGNSMINPGYTLVPNSYFGLDQMKPCLPSGDGVHAAATQTNRTLFYGNTHTVDTTNNGSKNLTLGGRLDVNSGIIGVGDRGVNGAGATNSIRMGTGTTLDETNKHTNAIAIGVNTATTAEGAVAISAEAKARTSYSIAIGRNATAGGDMVPPSNETGGAIAIGRNSLSNYIGAIALGNGAEVFSAKPDGKTTDGIAIGTKALVDNYRGMAIGAQSQAKGSQSIVLANNAPDAKVSVASGIRSQVYGVESEASGTDAVAIGYKNTVAAHRTYAIGNEINVAKEAEEALAFGTRAHVSGAYQISLGSDAGADAVAANTSGIAIGRNAGRYGQSGILNTAIGAASGQYVSGSYNIAMGTGAGSGTDAEKLAASQTISIGHNAKASKHTAIAMGTTAQARTEKSVALGENAIAGDTAAPTVKKGEYSTAIGSSTSALGYGATAVGSITKAKVNYATALGHEAEASGSGETSLGYGAGANSASPNGNRNGVNVGTNAGRYAIAGGNNVSVGISAGQYVEGDNNVAQGYSAGSYIKGNENVSIGTNANVGSATDKLEVNKTVAIGSGTKASANNAIAMGNTAQATAEHATAIGNKSVASNVSAIALGRQAQATDENAVALGADSKADGHSSFAGAVGSSSAGTRQVSIGHYAGNNTEGSSTPAKPADYAVFIGNYAGSDAAGKNGNTNGVAIGSEAGRYLQSGSNNTAIGSQAGQYVEGSLNASLGQGAGKYVKGNNNIAMGTQAGTGTDAEKLEVSNTAAIGNAAKALTDDSISIGRDSKAGKVDKFDGKKSIAIGYASEAMGSNAIALGSNAATNNGHDSIAMGTYAKTNGEKTISIGAYNTAEGAQSIVIAGNYDASTGSNRSTTTAAARRAIVVGPESHATAEDAVAIGNKNTVASARTYAIGNNINVAANTDDSLVFGTRAHTDFSRSIAMGVNASTLGQTGVAIGDNAVTNGVNQISIGHKAGDVTETDNKKTRRPNVGNFGVMIGHYAGAEYTADEVTPVNHQHGTVAVGTQAGRAGKDSWSNIALGNQAGRAVHGNDNIAIGVNSGSGKMTDKVESDGKDVSTVDEYLNVKHSISVGTMSAGKNNYSIAIGTQATAGNGQKEADGSTKNGYSVAIGTSANASALNSVALGAAASASHEYSVALGRDSKTSDVHTGVYTLNTSYAAAGQPNAANGTVSVGSAGKERQIQNVAAGVISATSTDAINGSQLYATNNYLSNLAGGVKNVLGGDAAVDNAGNVTMSNIGGTGKGNVNDAIAAANTKVAAGNNITVTPTTNADGSKTYTVATTKDLVVDSVKAGDTTVNKDGVTIAGGPSVKKDGINAGDKKITGVADGNVAAGSTDAVNGGQLAEVKAKADSAVQNVVSANPTALTATKAGDTVTLTPNFIAGDLVNADGTVKDPAAADEGKLVSAKTVADALKANHFVVNTQANGGAVDAASEKNAKVGSGNKVTFEAGKNLVAQQTNTANGGATVNYKLSDTLENLVSVKSAEIEAGIGPNKVVLNNNGVKVGDSTLNDKGLTINNGPSVTDAGIDAGNKKITGVADGNVAAGSTDAVNGGQLAEVKSKADSAVQDVKSGDENALTAVKDPNTNIVTVTPKLSGDLVDTNGNITAPTTPEEKGKLVTAGTVAEALANTHFVVDTKATDGELDAASQADQKIKASNKVTLQAGKNLKAKQTNGANGAEVEFSLKDSISLKEVKVGEGSANEVVLNNNGVNVAGNTYINKDGLNANDKKITNVAPGAVTAASKDAVNGSQLYNVANNVKDLIGPDAAIDPATGKVTVADPAKGIGETGKGNIGDAIKHVNDAAKAAAETAAKHTTVVEGKNVKVTKGKNAAGGDEYTVATKDDLDVTSVTAGNTTVNTNGLTITGGPSVTRGGIDAGNRIISGVKAGDVSATSQEAVNGSQLHATNTKLDGVKAKADTAVQDVKSGDENALTAVKDPNTNIVTVTPKLSGDLVDANGNITAPTTPADKGKLVTAGTVADALANTHFVVDTKATDGELDAASQADQKIKAGNKVTLQAGKNLKAKQTNGANGAQVEFSLKDSISLKEVTAGEGANQVVLGNDGVKVGGNTYINNAGLNANGNKITNVADGVDPTDAVNKSQLDAVKGVADSAVKSVDVANGEQNLVVDNTDPKNPKLSLKKDLTVDSVKAGDSTLNNDGLTIAGGPSVKKDGIDAGDKKITNVAAGDVAENSKDAVNGGQLYDVAKNVADLVGPDAKIDPATGKVTVTDPAKGIGETGKGNIGDAIKHVNDLAKNAADTAKKHTTVEQGDNIVVEESTNADGGKHYKVSTAKDLNVDSVKAGDTTVNNDGVTIAGGPSVTKGGINAGGNTITNVADGVNPNDAVNKGQLDAVKGVADSAVKSVDVANGEQNLVVDNSDPKNPKLSLKKDLTVDSVKAGDSTLNNDGLTIAGGPSVKKDGIDAGDKKITNVAAGDVAENSKDAVNGGQLYDVAKNVADLVGPDAKIDPATGKVTVTDPAKGIGETGKGNIGDAIKHVNDLAKNAADTAKKHTTVEQGDNIVVEESTNAEGGKHYKVSTAKNLNVDSVKAGDTTVNNDGVTINNGPSMTKDGINANNTKVTNVADGVDAADAVNKGQLDKVDTKVSNVAQNVVNVLGGDAAVNGNGDITMSNIGETGKGNINDAIKSVNDLAKKAAAEKTSVKAKEGRSNVTVTEGVNAAGGHEYTVDVERSVTNAGSDYVTVTNNHDADSNTTTYTVDVSAKTKASLAKADSAVQGLTSKDGNLNFTKGANGNVEVSFNDNLNVKNVTTDRVQVANGPSMSKDGINAAGKAISNVANGNVAADSKDAVNGGQLHETAKSVADVIGGGATVKDGKVVAGQNGIGNTGQNTVHGAIAAINQNTANNFNQIRGDLRKMDRDLRGGIAGALATAGLPQAFRPGKSMVAAAASTYRGQSGLAIGVSRISDNGKIILKVTGNTNSRGDFGGTIGAGYQW